MKTVTIEGETWRATMTADEYVAWREYEDRHPWLCAGPDYRPTLAMFLAHLRRGISLSQSPTQPV